MLILTYHNIGRPPDGAALEGLYVTERMFAFQMWYLRFGGFSVVSLKEMVDIITGITKPKTKKSVALTFDDGYMDFYDNAWPVLKKYGYPATVFVATALIGGSNVWDIARVNVKKMLMGWDKINALSKCGVVFGSHTKTHPSLVRVSEECLNDEITGSREELSMRLTKPVGFFCYPYGDFNDQVRQAVIRSGYNAALTTQKGYVRAGDDPFCLPRVSIKLNTHPLVFIYKLHRGCLV